MYIHERGHHMFSLYSYGSDYALVQQLTGNMSVINPFEIKKTQVAYMNDERTPCQSEPRREEMNTCIQRHIENVMDCQLPWNNVSTCLPMCNESKHYNEFLKLYNDITRKQEAYIAESTGCWPSCNRNEYSMKLINRIAMPKAEKGLSSFVFYYPTGRYNEKIYYYPYHYGDFFADVGGYLGLFLGYSALSFYDALKHLMNYLSRFKNSQNSSKNGSIA